jgi:tetraacyldisaccharide 4'-kinase
MKRLQFILLWPLSRLFGVIVFFRNALYNKRFLKVIDVSIPVVSVGNLTMGGTGKTPMLGALIDWSMKQNLSVGVVSRGYRGRFKGNVEVLTDDPTLYGDEPAMLKRRYPDVPIFVGADRISSIELMQQKYKVKYILADDAFQHRSLARKLDVVVIDALDTPKCYELLPGGKAREPMSSLERASAIVLNRTNLVTASQREEWIHKINMHAHKDAILIESEYFVESIYPIFETTKSSFAKDERVLLISGVGSPRSVEAVLKGRVDIARHLIYPDHNKYVQDDVELWLSLSRSLNITRILTTEKDAIKLRRLSGVQSIWVMDLVPRLSLNIKELYDEIIKIVD